jgi:hypothetical protein
METVEQSIRVWINSFDCVDQPIADISELSNGLVLFKILKEVSPSIWRDNKMDFENASTVQGRTKNIKHVFEGIQDFYKSRLSSDIRDDEINISNI